jgi:hypothetical protein
MKAAHRISAAVAVLALGGSALGLVRYQRRLIAADAAGSAASPSPSPPSAQPALPTVALAQMDAARLTKIVLTRPDDDDSSRTLAVTIDKRGQDWALTAPIAGEADRASVEEAIQNLETLHLWKEVDPGTRFYDQYDLTETKGLHIVAWRGADKVVDLLCGKGSTDGQLVRLPDRDGIYALINWGPQGYSGFLFTRTLRSWRETSIFKFAESDVVGIEIRNRNGVFLFSKRDGVWIGTRARSRGGAAAAWPRFDPSKIEQLLRDYRNLAADNFADGTSRADAGVDDAERTGGVIRIKLKSGATLTLRVGKPAIDKTRWAIKDGRWAVKDGGAGTLYVLAPWTAGWATADARKFQ